MPDQNNQQRGFTIEEAGKRMGVSRTWVFKLIDMGRIRMVDDEHPGKATKTLLSAEDVERERLYFINRQQQRLNEQDTIKRAR